MCRKYIGEGTASRACPERSRRVPRRSNQNGALALRVARQHRGYLCETTPVCHHYVTKVSSRDQGSICQVTSASPRNKTPLMWIGQLPISISSHNGNNSPTTTC